MGIQRWVASNDLIDFLRRKNTSKSQKNSQVNEKEEKNSSKAFVKRGKIYEFCLVSSAVALKLKCMYVLKGEIEDVYPAPRVRATPKPKGRPARPMRQ